MKYRSSTEGREIVKKDYRKKIIYSLEDFDEKGHLPQVVTIPPHTRHRMHSHERQTEVSYILEGEATITINSVDYLAKPGIAFTRGCGAVRLTMFTTF
jgi:mannose-6-phosphate isomerase-like protein (cupin superfamily)